MIRLTETNIKDFKLVDDGPCGENRKVFWDSLTSYIASKLFGAIEIDGVFRDVGGYFTTNYFKMDKIVIPEDTCVVDMGKKTVKFANDAKFAVFLHEVSHYYHLVKDKGKFISKAFEDMKPYKIGERGEHFKPYIKYLEYEAGWRSLYYSDIYNLYPDGDRTVLETNLRNMIHYCEIVNILDFNDQDQVNRRVDEWVRTTEKFNSIAEFKYVI